MSIEGLEDESYSHGCCSSNKLSICLCMLVVLLSFGLFIVTFVAIAYIGSSTTECTNLSCMKAAIELAAIIDDTVDPCDDFYGFVCGKFTKTAYEKQINNIINAERTKIENHLKTYIIEPIQSEDSQSIRMQKLYFQSCLNEDEIDENNDRTFFKRLAEVTDFPLLQRYNTWEENNFDWMQVMVKAREAGLPFEWFLKLDLYENENYELQLSHPEKCAEELSGSYFTMQKDILVQLARPRIDTISEFAHLERFERTLHSICINTSDVEVSLRRVFHLRLDNAKSYSFLKNLTGLVHKLRPDSVIALNLDYIYELNRLLKTTSKKWAKFHNQKFISGFRVQANYILWKIIQNLAPYLTQPIRDRYKEYLTEINGDFSRFEFCLDDTKSKFNHLSEITFLQNYLTPSMQEEGEELTSSIKEEIIAHIESVEWRSNKTKEKYLDLYDNLDVIVGGPEELFDDKFVAKYLHLGKLIFFYDDIIQMNIDLSRNKFYFKMNLIGHSVSIVLDSVIDANSNFNFILDEEEHQIIFPASIFGSTLYDTDFPQYINYAGLGTIIGKTLFKALNLQESSKFDLYKGYEENKKCLIESLHKTDKRLNASLLYSKNYESMVGHELAYRAYQTYVDNTENEEQLMNLEYSPNQLFWIKSSLLWCYQALPEEDEEEIDIQEIYKYRILESVKNSQFFANDFNCSADAPMNPINKCMLF